MPIPIASAAGAEALAITALGLALVALAALLGRRKVLSAPSAITLAFAGVLAVAWKYPDIVPVPIQLQLPFDVAEVQFFAALSLSMFIFALDVFTSQARALAEAQQRLARQEAEVEKASLALKMAAIIESSADAIVGTDLDGHIATWNRAAETIFGYSVDEVRDKPLSLLAPAEHEDQLAANFERVLAGDHVDTFETVRVKKDGTHVGVAVRLSTITDATGELTGASLIMRDITERIHAEELRKVALLDELTGLNNRRGFMMMAERQSDLAARDAQSFSIFFIDLNNLKTVNDNLGHREGDQMLRDAAAIIKESCRDTDIVGRVGGDEFCILVTGRGRAVDQRVAARLNSMTQTFNASVKRPYQVALSFGIARYEPEEPRSIEELMAAADTAMYAEKRQQKEVHPKLLVCDDDPSLLALALVLFSEDYDVMTAHSGREALRRAESDQPDLILLDLHLPDMEGTEVMKELRANPSTKLTPVIMITGAGDVMAELESLRAGVDDYVEKPFDEDALRARMDNILKRRVHR